MAPSSRAKTYRRAAFAASALAGALALSQPAFALDEYPVCIGES